MDTRDGRIYNIPDPGKDEEKVRAELLAAGWAEDDLQYLKPMAHHPTPTQRARRKVGRNESCPCGSGRKFKKCCLFRADRFRRL